jgi:hypothetical protein
MSKKIRMPQITPPTITPTGTSFIPMLDWLAGDPFVSTDEGDPDGSTEVEEDPDLDIVVLDEDVVDDDKLVRLGMEARVENEGV